MSLKIGSISGFQNEPCIYIIIKRDCIYIGETQRIPVARWGEHLCNMGTFSSKLQKHNPELAKSNDFKLFFFAYSCNKLREIFDSSDLIKRNTQYIEGVLHKKFVSHEMSTKLTLISDTEKTGVLRPNTNEADQIANDIFELMIEDIYQNV